MTYMSIFCMFLLLASSIDCFKHKSKITSKALEGSSFTRSELAKLWSTMFNGTRGQKCKSEESKKEAVNELVKKGEVPGVKGSPMAHKSHGASTAWIKPWGYGSAAYLFDYIDPLLQKDAVTAFQKVYDELKKISNKDTKDFKDPFDITKMASKENLKKIGKKNINKAYADGYYDMSINTVQLNKGMKEWHWYIEEGDKDYATDFVTTFDFNGDGRLNIRELIIGNIWHNKQILGTENCKFCFSDIGKTLDAIFTFIDCNSDGLLSAEELWTGLPQLKRGTNNYDIFKIDTNLNIRTDAINDFVIKNSPGITAKLTKEQFRTGVLLGFWDRQTSEKAIIKKDARNLKSLRWSDGGKKDHKAYTVMQQKKLAELIAKGVKKAESK